MSESAENEDSSHPSAEQERVWRVHLERARRVLVELDAPLLIVLSDQKTGYQYYALEHLKRLSLEDRKAIVGAVMRMLELG